MGQVAPLGRRLYPVSQIAQDGRDAPANRPSPRAGIAERRVARSLFLPGAHGQPGRELFHGQESVVVIDHY